MVSSLMRGLRIVSSATTPLRSKLGCSQQRCMSLKGSGRRFSGSSQWWQDRTIRFGHGFGDTQCILSYEIVTPFQMNQYLLGCTKTGKAALIDTGDAHASLETAKNFGFSIEMLLQTHAHIDHIAGLADIKSNLKEAKIHLHPADFPWYNAADDQARFFGMPLKQPPKVDVQLADGDTVMVGEIELRVLHTPGHCPGHVCFYCKDHGFLIAGDTLFSGSIGRTDFPLSDPSEMRKSLQKLFQLPDSTKVFSGHMEPTTIGRERKSNPFVQEML
mmetsp:Transcript_38769/g.91551  ORF Transcript_38769/g.91551 Transcript_38769/m.91551 type:complete len:273 (+) Transcript_38769:65-883(+)